MLSVYVFKQKTPRLAEGSYYFFLAAAFFGAAFLAAAFFGAAFFAAAFFGAAFFVVAMVFCF